MRNIQNDSGRLFSATVDGARPTLQDLMVATSVYVGNLEEAFPDAAQLISCYSAWEREKVHLETTRTRTLTSPCSGRRRTALQLALRKRG
jgi:hypothetical protein